MTFKRRSSMTRRKQPKGLDQPLIGQQFSQQVKSNVLSVTDSLGTTYVASLDGAWRGLDSQGNRIEVFVNREEPQRYSIQSDDSGHEYFVEVGMEGEFERWLAAEDSYGGHVVYD